MLGLEIIFIQVYDISKILLFQISLGKIILGFEILIVKFIIYIFGLIKY
jgi:hypothetical protein